MTKVELDKQRAEKNKGKITASHMAVLLAFKNNGWTQCQASDIAKKLEWSLGSVLQCVKELEEIGMVRTKLRLGTKPSEGYTEAPAADPFVIITGMGEQLVILSGR